ncbi:MAG TPA: pyridoxal 5'-phosphate synthase glutaminase subunit PdxT [Candidatus Nanopelagicales bacterium]|nr:pyridoxal 5'-phosphate synthase glutaminase subunit PdxT [Candidatus Nanopelagicales bacterium]
MTAAPLVGVLALQGDVREHERALEHSGARTRQVRLPADLEGVDALVVPGGESTTMSNLALRWGLMEPLRDLVRSGLPAYGSCAGMIMLAERIVGGRPDQETIGGLDVTVVRNAFGRQVDSFEADIDIPVLGERPVHAVFIRAPWVEQAGESVEVLGSVPAGPAAGKIVAVRQGHLLATSFHPELTGDVRVHEYFVEMVREQA